MFETPFAMVGTIITDPIHRRVGGQQVFRFRVASNSRRRTAEGSWEPGNALYATVNCWGRLADGVGGVLTKGDPVMVVGHVYTNEYEDKDGNRRSSMEVRAIAVGPDLARTRVRVDPSRHPAEQGQAVGAEADGDPVGEKAGTLPLSA